jgi:hypothetical protein
MCYRRADLVGEMHVFIVALAERKRILIVGHVDHLFVIMRHIGCLIKEILSTVIDCDKTG